MNPTLGWDAELVALAEHVRGIWGDDALVDAYVRALIVAPSTAGNSIDSLVRLLGIRANGRHHQASAIEDAAFVAALKADLRRLVRPH